MTLTVTIVDASQLPTWVFDTKAEPSNIRACTPAKTPRYGSESGSELRRQTPQVSDIYLILI